MKRHQFTLLLLLAGFALGFPAELRANGSPGPGGADEAVVLWEMRLYEKADFRSEVLATVQCGDLVTVLGPRERRRSRVRAGDVVGWVFTTSLVELSAPGAAARLLVAAHERETPPHWSREPDYLAALALYSRHMEFFPDSDYAALALYRFGQMGDRLAVEFTREVNEAVDAAVERDKPSAIRWENHRHLEESAARKYEKWGLTFRYHHCGGHYYYDGQVYERIVEQHGGSEWADNAAFQLSKLVRQRVEEWEGWPDEPLEELDLWREFVTKYPRSELKPKALLEMVYLNRVLHEIRSHSRDGFADPKKAERHLEAARELCDSIRREFPRTMFAAEAERNLAELAEGIHVYMFGAGIE